VNECKVTLPIDHSFHVSHKGKLVNQNFVSTLEESICSTFAHRYRIFCSGSRI